MPKSTGKKNWLEWFKASFWDDDGSFLKIITLLSLLIIILVLLFAPKYPARSLALAEPATNKNMAAKPTTGIKSASIIIRPIPSKKLYFLEKPSVPLAAETAVVPTPTPGGGGKLRKIAFASNRADGRYLQIYWMDADGNNIERLHESRSFDRDPHFSYDGNYIAFSSNRSGEYQIYLLDLGARTVRQLTKGGKDKTNPFWRTDDQQIVYTLHVQGSSELGVVNFDGTGEKQLTNKGGQNHAYGFSPDGQYVSFETSLSNRSEIYLYNLSEKKKIPILGIDDLTWCEDPVFSPQGDHVIFSSNSLERNVRQLYIYDFTWNKYFRLTEDELDKDDPIFSPDGTKIAYTALWENAWNIFIMNEDGTHVRNLTKSYYDHTVPSWK